MEDLHWKTAITKVEPNKLLLRGYKIDQLMGNISFSQAIYLAIKGELPSTEVGKMIDAILVSSVDHGATPPSTLAAITVASTGASINDALAAGILAISRLHGGAIEGCMEILQEAIDIMEKNGKNINEAAEELVKSYRETKKRILGFGHRIHTADPRTARLYSLAQELGFAGKYVEMAKNIEKALEQSLGKKLPINVDGAIATILCELGIPSELGNTFFIMARLPGLIAHIHEEKIRMRPMRRIHPTDHEYDGPAERTLP
jgi:citrate synthase